PATLSSFDPYIKRRESQRLVQFLMALRHDFEGLRSSILHREPLYSVDSVVSELLAEEIRLKSLDDQKIVTQQGSSIFAASQRSSNGIRKKPIADNECAYCKQKGHWKSECPLKPKQPPHLNNGIAASSLDLSMIEQFQKYLSFQNHAMTSLTDKCLLTSSQAANT
ncbi:gag-pol polyprotein, partial [Tanacetum coccineum]